MSNEYKYNFFLRLGIQFYLEMSILSLLNIRYAKFRNVYQMLSFTAAVLAVVMLLVFFGGAMNFSCKNYLKYKGKNKVDVPECESMFGSYKTQHMPQALFNNYFMLRRLLYACIIVFLVDFPMMQAFGFMVICVPILAYHLVMSPYIEQTNNVLMNVNEVVLITIGCFFYYFAEPNSNESELELLGWIVVGIIMSMFLLNIVVIWVCEIRTLRSEYTHWVNTTNKNKSIQRQQQLFRANLNYEEFKMQSMRKIDSLRFGQSPYANRTYDPTTSNKQKMVPSQFLRLNMASQALPK